MISRRYAISIAFNYFLLVLQHLPLVYFADTITLMLLWSATFVRAGWKRLEPLCMTFQMIGTELRQGSQWMMQFSRAPRHIRLEQVSGTTLA